jgi:hypothetical protein
MNGGAPAQLGTRVRYARPAAGSKVVFADNYVATTGAVDVHMVDLSVSTQPTLIAPGANGFGLSPDHARIVYATNSGTAGVYVTAVP